VPIAFLAAPFCADFKGHSKVAVLIELQPNAPFEVALKS
jgi:hypothetical protein